MRATVGRRPDRRPSRAVFWAGLLALLFVSGSLLAPILESADVGWGGVLRLGYAPLCHQKADRSLVIGQSTQAVCARCSGLYLGGVGGLLVGAFLVAGQRLRLRASWLAWAAAPTVIDALLAWTGLPALPNLPRLLLAVPAGVMAALFLAAGIADLFSSAERTRCRELVHDDPRTLEETHG